MYVWRNVEEAKQPQIGFLMLDSAQYIYSLGMHRGDIK